MIIDIDEHALFRIQERGPQFNLNENEITERIIQTIKIGNQSRKHKSRIYKTNYLYFSDNISLYVIFKQKKNHFFVKTIIIEEGRE